MKILVKYPGERIRGMNVMKNDDAQKVMCDVLRMGREIENIPKEMFSFRVMGGRVLYGYISVYVYETCFFQRNLQKNSLPCSIRIEPSKTDTEIVSPVFFARYNMRGIIDMSDRDIEYVFDRIGYVDTW